MLEQNTGAIPHLVPEASPAVNTALPGVGALLAEAWKIYVQHFWRLIGISVVPVVPILIFVGLLAIVIPFSRAAGSPTGLVMLFYILIVGLVIAAAYFLFWSQAALFMYLLQRNSRLAVIEAYRQTKVFIWPMCLAGVLTALAIFGGMLLFIIPGIIVVVWLSLTDYVIVGEGLRAKAAMLRSKWYVKGYAGRVFWRWFAIWALVGGGLMLLSYLLGAGKKTYTIGDTVLNIISFVLGPLFAVYGVLVYEHLKRLKTKSAP